jgi:hypothetical protein
MVGPPSPQQSSGKAGVWYVFFKILMTLMQNVAHHLDD